MCIYCSLCYLDSPPLSNCKSNLMGFYQKYLFTPVSGIGFFFSKRTCLTLLFIMDKGEMVSN